MNTFILTGTSSDFTTSYTPPLRFDPNKRYEAALLSIDLYYSFPNITSENNALKYSTDFGLNWKTITLDTGSYELSAINNEIQRQMISNDDYDKKNNKPYVSITANISKLKSIVDITNRDYIVDLDTIGPTLGFPLYHGILAQGYRESVNIVDIIKINSVLVNIDIISGSYLNGSQSPVLYSFFPNVSPGHKIVERPNPSLIYYPVNRPNIDSIRVWLTDQNNNLIDVRGERVTVRIAIREVYDLKREIKEAITQLHSQTLPIKI